MWRGVCTVGRFHLVSPADDRVGDSESDVDDVEPDPVPVQTTTMAVESLCPPVVTQTRHKEGCDPASPRRLRRGRDVLMEDSMVAVDSRRISVAPDADVVPDLVPVQMAMMAVELLCPPVVTQTRPKEGCDPASPRLLRRGRDVLMEDSMVTVDTRRISIAQDTDVVSVIYMMPDCIPAVMPMLAAAPQAASNVAQTRLRGDCSVNFPLPVDGSIEALDDDAPEVLSSGRETAGISSEVGSDGCVVPDVPPAAVSVRTVVAEV